MSDSFGEGGFAWETAERKAAGLPRPSGSVMGKSLRWDIRLTREAQQIFPTPRVCAGLRSSGMNRTEMYRAFWPTPRSEDSQCAGNHPGAVDSLHAAVKLWPTPTADDANNVTRQSGTFQSLTREVKTFPTANANDWKGSTKAGQRRGQLTDPAMGVIEAGGQLNPTWVEWLMGYPSEWTVLRRSVMPSSRNVSKK